MRRIFILYIYLLFLSFISCDDDFLERAPDQSLSEEQVFTDFTLAEEFHTDIYSFLQKGFNRVGSFQPVPMASASDESDSPAGWHGTKSFNNGVYDDQDNQISNYYSGIRKVNIFLNKTDIIPFPDKEKKMQMTGEAFFLRALFYHEMTKRYGGMPIIGKVFSPNDDLMVPRSTYKECINYMIADLDTAIKYLPYRYADQSGNYGNDMGRATKGAAMALKSRILLYAASPLWKSEDWKYNVWDSAAKAAKAVIDLRDSSDNPVYELYGETADDYASLFFLRPNDGNKEVIFYYSDSPRGYNDDEINVWAPNGDDYEGVGGVCPTQNFVDLFEMANGSPITETGSGYDPNNPYVNRDPRFYKIVLYNGAIWQDRIVETYVGGAHRKNKQSYTSTGYYVRKYLPEEVTYQSTVTSYHNWIYFRLAEMYLNYAEALNESQGPLNEVYDAVSKVRNRAGMPALPPGLSQDQMRSRIQNERAIELCFEEHRWWDARRWLKAKDWFGGYMYEMDIQKSDDTYIYSKIPLNQPRIYQDRMNLYPIPIKEMNKNSLWNQNPGW